MKEDCPHCVDTSWPHEHVGDPELPLLLIARKESEHKEYYFHGTMKQCDMFVALDSSGERQDEFELLLIKYRDWDRALAIFTGEEVSCRVAVEGDI